MAFIPHPHTSNIPFYSSRISDGCRLLRDRLRDNHRKSSTRLTQDSTPAGLDRRLVVNWGCSITPEWMANSRYFLNKPQAIAIASNKLKTFQRLHADNIPTPDWTVSRDAAMDWLDSAHSVVCRHVLQGHSGEGIEIVEPDYDGEDQIMGLPDAPLYVQYKKKKYEYRVHIFNNELLFIQQKKKQNGLGQQEGIRDKVRSHANGWNFARNDINITLVQFERLEQLAKNTVTSLGLDFGAVDIIYNQREDRFYVLEVNTAPGLEGQSVIDYAEAISNHYEFLRDN